MRDFGAFKVPEQLTDEQVLFLTDIFPTGFMAAENCGSTPDRQWLFGDADQSGSLRFEARFFWARVV